MSTAHVHTSGPIVRRGLLTLSLAIVIASTGLSAFPPVARAEPFQVEHEPQLQIRSASEQSVSWDGFVETKLTAFDGERNDAFGKALDVDGRRVVATGGGSAYVYEFDGVSYSETKLVVGDGTSPAWSSVSVFGDRIVLGTTNAGLVWVYEYQGSTWTQRTITPSDGASGNLFGMSVAQDPSRIVVGAPNYDLQSAGSVYVYEDDGLTWSETKLVASDGRVGDLFGYRVSIDGDRIIVGSHDSAAYIYDFDGLEWIETRLAGLGSESSGFGYAVSVDGDRAVVGAPYDDERAGNAGAAFIYEFDGTTWLETKLTASDGSSGDRFGRSVAVDGSRVVVGAPHDDANGDYSGAAYVFNLSEAGWIESKLAPSDGNSDDIFGEPVAIEGSRIVVGAPSDDDRGDESGSAYVFLDPSLIDVERTVPAAPISQLGECVPKPVRSQARCSFLLGTTTWMRLVIYDILGREIATPVDAVLPVGRHIVSLSATRLPAGLYFYRMITADAVEARSLIVSH